MRRLLLALAASPLAFTLSLGLSAQDAPSTADLIDRYVDARMEAKPSATPGLLAALRELDADTPSAIEALLRAPRASYPDVADLLGKTTVHDVACYHVDYASKYRLFVPKSYRPENATPLVVVGHGGNSSMSPARAGRVAAMYLGIYAPALARDLGAIVVAPDSSRGWGHIGNSLILSTISDVQRRFHIDPDRVYATGHSMGGHMTYRAALNLGDRFGAVSPHSGGYDYVEKKAIGNLFAVPGYVTWGKREPYGIDKDNRTNAAWAKKHGLDWTFVEKPGGHEIYQDELPKIAKFFAERPRDLYRDVVYLRAGGAMKFVKTWGIKGWPEHEVHHETRPLRWNVRHWLEVTPRPDVKGALTVVAKNAGDNAFEVTSDQIRELTIHLHPKMIDFEKPVRIKVNGDTLFEGEVTPDPAHMLDTVREFDDRGRVFWAKVTVAVETDREVRPSAPGDR